MVVGGRKIGNYIELGGLLVVLLYVFFPWNKINTIIPSQLNIVFHVQYLLLLQLLICLLQRYLLNDWKVKVTLIDGVVFLYCIYLLFSNLFLMQKDSGMEFTTLLLTYFAFRGIRIENRFYCLAFFLIVGCVQLFYAVIWQSGYLSSPDINFSRICGTFFNTGIWGGFLVILVCISIYFVIYMQAVLKKYTMFLFTILGLFFLFQSESRAAWLAFICMGLRLIITRLSKRMRYFVFVLSGIMFFFSIFICAYTDFKFESILGRLLIWRISLNMIADKFVLGFGLDGFQREYMEYQASYLARTNIEWMESVADNNLFAFNELIHVFTEQGIIGLVLVLLIFYLLFSKKYDNVDTSNKDCRISNLLRLLILGWSVFSFFSYPASVFQMLFLLIVFVSMLSSTKIILYSCEFSVRVFLVMSMLIVLSFSFCNIYLFSPYYQSFCKWNLFMRNRSFEQSEFTIKQMEDISRYLEGHASFNLSFAQLLYENGRLDSSQMYYEKSYEIRSSYSTLIEMAKVYIENLEYSSAKSTLIKSQEMVPNRILPYYYLGVLYKREGDIDAALNVLSEGLSKKIKVRSLSAEDLLEKMNSLKDELIRMDHIP